MLTLDRECGLLSDSLDLPRAFGPYVLLRRLAVGGMAEIYVAKTKGIGGFEKLVAIKVIHPRFSEDENFVTMLVEEAKISVQLNHVNIAQTFDLGCIEDTYFIAMEYIEGADAFQVQKRARERDLALPVDLCCHIAAEICQGLAYAHRKRDADGKSLGIVHRDVSPQNVLISYAGEVKLVDFGIAKAALREGQTEVGVIKGKYYYMSPEQAWGDPVDARTDVFSTGLLLYELLAGEMVYHEDNVPALLDRVRKAEIPSVRRRRRDVPPELEAILARALAREVEDRYASAHLFAEDLTRFLYVGFPTFTASRLSQLMATLFPTEVRRHSQVLDLPFVADVGGSDEESLAVMHREEFAPNPRESVILDLGQREPMTPPLSEPLRPRSPERATRPLRDPSSMRDSTTAELEAPKNPWDDPTLLKGEPVWDESTLVEQDLEISSTGKPYFASRGRGDEDTELHGEKTVATSGHTEPASVLPAPRVQASALGGLGVGAVASSASFSAAPAGVLLGPPSDAVDLPVEPYPSQAPYPSPAPDALPAHDPFVAAPPVDVAGLSEDLGKPAPVRWVLPAVAVLLVVLVAVGIGAWWAARPDPTVLEVISVPEGAEVTLDGRPLPTHTPVRVPDLEVGRTYHLRLTHRGYEPREALYTVDEGENRSVFLLHQIRVTLHVTTDPEGAQVWVDNVLRGSAPLDISGLQVGQAVLLRASAPGRQTVTQRVALEHEVRDPRVTLTLPAP